MQIDIKQYLLDYIGSTSWHGETNSDNESSDNLVKLDNILNEIEDLRETLIYKLEDHRDYRKGNASAEHLHRQAGKILKNHRYPLDHDIMDDEEFNKYWENEDE